MSTIHEKLAAGQPAFTTEVQQGDYIAERALGANDPTALHITARFQIYRASYSRPAANTTLSYGGSTAYFDTDDGFTDLRGGLCEFTRHWYTVPATWQEPGGTFAFTFPAYAAGVAFGNVYSATGAVSNGNYYSINTSATNIALGETVIFDLSFVRSQQNYHVTFVADAKYANSGTNVGIAKMLPGTGAFSSVSGIVREYSSGRNLPATMEVDSFVMHEYAIADATSVDILLPQVDRFSPFNSSGYEVDTLLGGTATYPNRDTYASMVAAGSLIVARRSDRTKYAGNIWERTTLVVAAR